MVKDKKQKRVRDDNPRSTFKSLFPQLMASILQLNLISDDLQPYNKISVKNAFGILLETLE